MHRRLTARRLAGDLANLLDAEGKPEKAKTVRRSRCVDAGGSGSGNGVRQSAMCANCRAIEPVGGDIKFSNVHGVRWLGIVAATARKVIGKLSTRPRASASS